MKVLVCAYDRPGHVATGPNAWLQRLVPDLIGNYELNVHTLFIYSGAASDCPTMSFFKTQGLPVSSINRDELPYVADQVKALLSIVKKEAIQVVLANLVIPAFYATRYLKNAQIPVIGVLHSQDDFYKGVINKFVNGAPEDRLSAVVSVSDFINGLVHARPTTIPTKVIACGTPLHPQKAHWDGQATLKIIYAGRLVIEAKQILKLTSAFCKAAKINASYAFSFYGDGDQVPEMEAIIKQYKAQAAVQIHQALPPSQIIDAIASHQVFTLMSDYEGMPVALMEAMACGVVPVCLAERSGVNEIIEHGENGFIVQDREADYQKHLKMLLDDPDLWQRLSNNAVKTIQERYSSAQTHRQWHDLLQSFSDQQTGSIKIPSHIKLEGDLLYYGDNRKPAQGALLKQNLKEQWMRLRLFLRPRARLRKLINNQNK